MKDTNWIYILHLYCQKAIVPIARKFPSTWCMLVIQYIRFFFWYIPLQILFGTVFAYVFIVAPIDLIHSGDIFATYGDASNDKLVFLPSLICGVVALCVWTLIAAMFAREFYHDLKSWLKSNPDSCIKIEITKSNDK